MTPAQLKFQVEQAGHEPFFFTRKTMQFFGDTMRNYGVRSTVITANYDADGNHHEGGIQREVWELYRKQPVKHGLRKSAYFDRTTFKQVFKKSDGDTP